MYYISKLKPNGDRRLIGIMYHIARLKPNGDRQLIGKRLRLQAACETAVNHSQFDRCLIVVDEVRAGGASRLIAEYQYGKLLSRP